MTSYLIDTSAAALMLINPSLRKAWEEPVTAGIIAVCDAVELEMLYTAQSLADRLHKKESLDELFGWVVTPDDVWLRMHRVQRLLTEQGHHRSAGLTDLAIAATAEANNLTILHYDRDFETVAGVTGQSTHWIAKPGSIN